MAAGKSGNGAERGGEGARASSPVPQTGRQVKTCGTRAWSGGADGRREMTDAAYRKRHSRGAGGDEHGEYRESLGGEEYTNTVYMYSIFAFPVLNFIFLLNQRIVHELPMLAGHYYASDRPCRSAAAGPYLRPRAAPSACNWHESPGRPLYSRRRSCPPCGPAPGWAITTRSGRLDNRGQCVTASCFPSSGMARAFF